MLEVLPRLLPAVIGMTGGFLLRRLGAADQRDGDFVFKLVFYVCVPALMFNALSSVDLTGAFVVFPLAALAMVATGFVAGLVLVRRFRGPATETAVLLVACMSVNTGFELPFVQALFGSDGVARIAAFDAVNTTVTFSWAYYVAARGNPEHTGGSLLLNRLVRSPPLYAIAAGLAVNLLGVQVPPWLSGPIGAFGATTAVLISLGVGILFEPPGTAIGRAAAVVGTRLVTGLAVAVIIVLIFDMHGVDRTVLLLLGITPVAFVTVTFASLENLDVRLAVNALSISLVTSLVLSLGITLVAG